MPRPASLGDCRMVTITRTARSLKKARNGSLNLFLHDLGAPRGGPFEIVGEPDIRTTRFDEEAAEYEIVIRVQKTV